jgi:hypothetical protein
MKEDLNFNVSEFLKILIDQLSYDDHARLTGKSLGNICRVLNGDPVNFVIFNNAGGLVFDFWVDKDKDTKTVEFLVNDKGLNVYAYRINGNFVAKYLPLFSTRSFYFQWIDKEFISQHDAQSNIDSEEFQKKIDFWEKKLDLNNESQADKFENIKKNILELKSDYEIAKKYFPKEYLLKDVEQKNVGINQVMNRYENDFFHIW